MITQHPSVADRRRGLLRALVALVVVSCVLAAGALAAPQAKVTEAQIARGKKMCTQADALLAKGKPAEALAIYQEVLTFLPLSPRAKKGVAKCQALLGQSADPDEEEDDGEAAPTPAAKSKAGASGPSQADASGGGLPLPVVGGVSLIVVLGLVTLARRRGRAKAETPAETTEAPVVTEAPTAEAAMTAAAAVAAAEAAATAQSPSETTTPESAREQSEDTASPFATLAPAATPAPPAETPSPFALAEPPAVAPEPEVVEEEAPSPFAAITPEAAPAETEPEPDLPPPFAPFDLSAPVTEEPTPATEAEEVPSAFEPFGAVTEEAEEVLAPFAADTEPAPEGAALDVAAAEKRAQEWWQSSGQVSATCEVCGAILGRGQGYHLDTATMLESESYLEMACQMGAIFGGDEGTVREETVERVKAHAGPWHVCNACLEQHFKA